MLSLKWFKSAIERTIEKVVENKIEQAFDALDREEGQNLSSYHPDAQWYQTTSSCTTSIKPYLNIKMVNDTLTIVMNDGNIITKSPATSDDFNAARDCKTEACLFDLVSSQEVRDERRKAEAELERAKAIKKGAEYLSTLDEFEMKDGSLYFKGINRSIPPLMVEELLEVVGSYGNTDNDKFKALHRFFMWCCLNPRAEVAHELYRFLKENSFRITKQGFFVALRNVVSLCDDTELVDFVSNSYNKIKAIWKKDPSKFEVVRNNGQLSLEATNPGGVHTGELVGNLTQLYLDLPEMKNNRYTDDWTKTFDIRVGRPVNMPLSECNWSTQDCAAAGLHFTSDQIHYVGCGDQSVLLLINPMKVVGIGEHKGRCYEYLPIMTVPREEATSILHDLDFDTLALDEDYAIRELESLTEKAKEGFTAEAKKYSFNIPAISTVEIQNIVASLEEMRDEITKRVKILD